LAGFVLMDVARREIHVDAPSPRRRSQRQADRATADHEDAGTRLEPDAAERVDRDRERFDERTDFGPHASGQAHEASAVDDHLVGEAAVDGDTVQAGEAGAAQLRLARPATVALAAPGVRLDRDRS